VTQSRLHLIQGLKKPAILSVLGRSYADGGCGNGDADPVSGGHWRASPANLQ
jgi:hypothetical protein